MESEKLRQEILEMVRRYYQLAHTKKEFVPGVTLVNYGGRVYDGDEMEAMVNSVLDFWLTLGKEDKDFTAAFSVYTGIKNVLLANSGSSANLLAVSALKSPLLDRRLEDGDEIITPAMTFPTTLAPIIQNNLVPVLVDCQIGTYNIDVSALEAAYSDKTRAIFVPHTLGNPADIEEIQDFARKRNLYLIEDCCDALGSEYNGKKVGLFGDLATFSFYPAHHITMGEGGAVATDDTTLYRALLSLRDWGRDCFCPSGQSEPDGACGRRLDWPIEGLAQGYDHRYVYSHIGYNLKPLDIQAAMGVQQLKKLPQFITQRNRNFQRLYEGLTPYQSNLLLPKTSDAAYPSWFAFPIMVLEDAPFSRNELVTFLEDRKIQTRLLFAGNILKQPGYRDMNCRVVGDLENTNRAMERAFFIGVYPGLDDQMLNYVLEQITEFIKKH